MYMTVLKVNMETLKKQEYPMQFTDMNFMHKWFTSQFKTSREESHILFSLQYEQRDLFIYVQSDEPLPQKNIERAGMQLVRSFSVPKVENGDTIMFRSLCVPEKRDSKTRKRYFLNDEQERLGWIRRQTSAALCDVTTKELGITKLKCKDHIQKGVDLSGMGTVTDKEKFYEMVRNGIGRCKCYGFGLMLFDTLQI